MSFKPKKPKRLGYLDADSCGVRNKEGILVWVRSEADSAKVYI